MESLAKKFARRFAPQNSSINTHFCPGNTYILTTPLLLTNGNTLLENKCQRAAETLRRGSKSWQSAMYYHCVSKRLMLQCHWGLSKAASTAASLLYFRSLTSRATIRAVTYAWNLLRAYRYRWPGFSRSLLHWPSWWSFHTSDRDLSSIGLGTTNLFWEREQHRLCTCSIIDHVYV